MQQLYFNHAGTSWPKPDFVHKAVQDALHRSPTEWPATFDHALDRLKQSFQIGNSGKLLLTPGCTSSLAIAIQDLNWSEGDFVLHSCWEHHALHRPLLKLQQLGVTVNPIPGRLGNPVDLHALEERLKAGSVKLIALTAASNVTGAILPYQEVIQLARHYSAITLIDAAQLVGWQRLNFSELGADLIAFGSHKGLLAPWGIGGLYIRNEVAMECVSARCQLQHTAQETPLQPRPGYCDVGSVDQSTLAGLKSAVDWLKSQDLDQRRQESVHRLREFKGDLQEIRGIKIHSPIENNEDQLPILSFTLNGMPSSVVADKLLECGITVGSGLHCSPLAHETLGTQELGTIRISLGIQQPHHELKQLTESLYRLARTFT